MTILAATLFLATLSAVAPPLPLRISDRTQAAVDLREALAPAPRLDATGRLHTLVEAGRSAARLLPGLAIEAQLLEAISDAQDLSHSDLDGAVRRLTGVYGRTIGDLEHRRYEEAALPEGFPDSTPVGGIETKRYPAYRMVRTQAGRAAFWSLFRHISANDIAMTAPVEMTLAEDQGAMREVDMAFLYGSPALGTPGDAGAVEVLDVEPRLVASIGCRGNNSPAAVATARHRLDTWLTGRPDLIVVGEPRVMAYNSPMVRADRRTFEVQIPVLRRVMDFSDPTALAPWNAVNDGVMGGVSDGRIVWSNDGVAVFEGNVSLERNGGFASARAPVADGAFTGSSSLRLRVRGDGKTYKLRLRTNKAFDGVNYEVPFATTAGEWADIEFPISAFRPVWRGRPVPEAPALEASAIVGLGFLISDRQVGPFRLEVAAVDAD